MAAAGLLPKAFSSQQKLPQHSWLAVDANAIVLQRESDGLPVVFMREALLPRHCGAHVVASAEMNVETLAHTLAQFNQPLTPSQLLRWRYEARRIDTEFAAADLATNLTLFQLLANMLDDTADEHAFLLAQPLQNYYRVSNSALGEAQRNAALQHYLKVLQRSSLDANCEDKIWHGRLSNEQYYVAVMELQGFSEDAAYSEAGHRCLQSALANIAAKLKQLQQVHRQAPELLIDLRFNQGGSLLLASQLANSLQPTQQPLAIIDRHAVQEQRPPNLSQDYRAGVVLVSEITASAAEHLAQALRIRGFSLQGQITRGAFSPTTVRTLPNGWIFGLSMYAVDDVRDGYNQPLPEGKGLRPDLNVPLEVLLPFDGP